MQVDRSPAGDDSKRKSHVRFWYARWAPQKLFMAARRDLSATPASHFKAVESVDLDLAAAAVAVVKA